MIIFVTKNFTLTASAIVEELGDVSRRIKGYRGRRIRSTPTDLVVNWGYYGNIACNCPVLNSHISTDKAFQSNKFQEAGVPHPQRRDSRSGEWIVKPKSGHGGHGIRVYNAMQCADYTHPWLPKNDNEFQSEYIKKEAEFRVHVLGGEAVAWTRKKALEGVNTEEVVAWNHANGFVQQTIKNRIQRKTTGNVAIAACNALGYDFGAVDIVMDRLGSLYVLEVNSAPALQVEDRLDKYVEYFREQHDNGIYITCTQETDR